MYFCRHFRRQNVRGSLQHVRLGLSRYVRHMLRFRGRSSFSTRRESTRRRAPSTRLYSHTSSPCNDDSRTADFFNAGDFFLASNIRNGRGGRVAVRNVQGQSFSYNEIHQRALRTSGVLRDVECPCTSVKIGDRVMICLHNSVDLVTSVFGTLYAGGVLNMTVPFSPSDDFYTYMLNYSEAKVVIIPPSLVPRFRETIVSQTRSLARVLVAEEDTREEDGHTSNIKDDSGLRSVESDRRNALGNVVTFRSLRRLSDTVDADPSAITIAHTNANDIAAWFFTSGTTGPAKGCVHRHYDMPYAAKTYAREIMDLSEIDVTVTGSPMTGPYAFQCNLLYPFWAGASSILDDTREPSMEAGRFLDIVRERKPTIGSVTPRLIRSLLQRRTGDDDHDDESVRRSLASVRYLITAGDVLPASLHNEWLRRFDVPLLDGLGNSEAFSFYISNRLDRRTSGSVGHVVGGFNVKRVDVCGRTVRSPEEPGEICVKGLSVSTEYWGREEESAEVFQEGGWFHTGDLATEDADGRFYLLGRKTDLRSLHDGQWRHLRFSFLEIENMLLAEKGIKDCAVCEGVAFVVSLDDNNEREELKRRVGSLLRERYARESFRVTFVDRIPRNARDKIDRHALRGK